jgi:DNA polymerase
VDTKERFLGKTVVLGCGYQTGAGKLQVTLKAAKPSVDMPAEECERIIHTYRSSVPKIVNLWAEGEKAIRAMYDENSMWFGREGVVRIEGKRGVLLPSGLYISYPQLHRIFDSGRHRWQYKDDTGLVDLYGGKLVENVCQALARIIVMYQMLRIARKLPTKLTVHDSVVALAPEEEVEAARAYVEECMRWVPAWAKGCPINCESGIGRNYGEA